MALPSPEPGDILWCRFPEDRRLKPAPRPRPVLVLAVGHHESDPDSPMVRIGAGSSRKLNPGEVYPWELLIEADGSEAFRTTGLSYSTKFNIRNTLELPFEPRFFASPPRRPFGNSPKLGTLHPAYIKALRRAARGAR